MEGGETTLLSFLGGKGKGGGVGTQDWMLDCLLFLKPFPKFHEDLREQVPFPCSSPCQCLLAPSAANTSSYVPPLDWGAMATWEEGVMGGYAFLPGEDAHPCSAERAPPSAVQLGITMVFSSAPLASPLGIS